jgi:hypothetical protein
MTDQATLQPSAPLSRDSMPGEGGEGEMSPLARNSMDQDRPGFEGESAPRNPPDLDPADSRRHSLPALNFFRPAQRSINVSTASLAESEHAAWGSLSRDHTRLDHRTTDLRLMTGRDLPRQSRRPPSSIGSRASVQPVIVRAYSQAARARSESRHRLPIIFDEGRMDRAGLPPLEAFNFQAIMRSIEPEVAGTLDAIADICANNRYSLANQYEVHMPPGGHHTTFRASDHPLNPVSEATSEGGSASPTNSKKSANHQSSPVAPPEPDSAALDKLLSSSLAGGRSSHTGQSPTSDTLRTHMRGLLISRKESTSEPVDRSNRHSPRSLSASMAFLSSSSKAFQARQGNISIMESPLGLMSGIGSQGGRDSNTGLTATKNSSLPDLSSHVAPQVITETQTGVKSGQLLSSGEIMSQPSGAAKAVSLVRDRHSRRTSLLEGITSWIPWSSRTQPSTAPVLVEASDERGQATEAESALRDMLRATPHEQDDKLATAPG